MEIDTNTSTFANSVPVKLSYEGQMRRFPFAGGDSFNVFYAQVLDILGLEKGANVFIKYTDPENDLITITSDVELRSAIVPGELLRVVVIPQAARGVDIPPSPVHAPSVPPTVVTAPIVHIPFVAPPAGVHQPEGAQFYQPYQQQPPFPFGGAFPPGFGREFGPGRWSKKMDGEVEKKEKKEKKEKDEEKREKKEKKHEKKMLKMMKKMHHHGHPYSHPQHSFPPPPFAAGLGGRAHHPHHVHPHHDAHHVHPHAHIHPHHFAHHPHANAYHHHAHGRFMGAPHPHDKKNKLIARFVSDVTIEDGAVVAPNHNFVKTWRLRNAGVVAWPAESGLLFIGKRSDDLGAPAFIPVVQQVVVDPAATGVVAMMTDGAAPAVDLTLAPAAVLVEPGQEIDISVPLIAPAQAGRYTAYFRMCTKEGRKFGQRVWVSVVVPPTTAEGALVAVTGVAATTTTTTTTTGTSSSEGEKEADRYEALVDVVMQNELFRTFGLKRHWVFRLLQKNDGDVEKVIKILTKKVEKRMHKMQKKQQQQQ